MFKSIRGTGGRSLRHQSKMKSVGKCSIYYKVWVNSKLSIGWLLRATSWRDANVVYRDSYQHNPAARVETLGYLDKKFFHGGHSYCRRTYEESRKIQNLFGFPQSLLYFSPFSPLRFRVSYQSHHTFPKSSFLLIFSEQFLGGRRRNHPLMLSWEE